MGSMAPEDRRDYAVLISLATREESEVAAAALRADGIDAFIGNSNHAYVEWLLTPALGGLQILVPRAQLADAKSFLRERIRESSEMEAAEVAVRRDHWKGWFSIALLLGPFAVYLAIGPGGDLASWLYSNSLGW
jgi:hypothetical protein